MRKTIIVAILVLGVLPLAAQSDKHHDKKPREITEMVSNLSVSQKKKIDAISRESREVVGKLRKQKKAVCDSIALIMDKDGDQSAVLYPMFEREAMLQVAINKEMYSTKRRVDELLSNEQRNDLRRACEQERKRHKREQK